MRITHCNRSACVHPVHTSLHSMKDDLKTHQVLFRDSTRSDILLKKKKKFRYAFIIHSSPSDDLDQYARGCVQYARSEQIKNANWFYSNVCLT